MAAKKVLIFIVAYNAETTIQSVLTRIPVEVLRSFDYEILIVDDESHDRTFELANAFKQAHPEYKLTVLFNPLNQGYGGNQKIGYEYAIQNGFDAVALLHGDGQYAPEMLGTLIEPILAGEADAVFGSRMMQPRNALKGVHAALQVRRQSHPDGDSEPIAAFETERISFRLPRLLGSGAGVDSVSMQHEQLSFRY